MTQSRKSNNAHGRPDRRRGRFSNYRTFAIVHEDEHVAAVTKSDGLLVVQAENNEQTLQDQVRRHLPRSKQPDAAEPSAVHRLDRDTTGLVLFGRTRRGLEGLSRLVREGLIEKYYYVLTVGVPQPAEGRIDAPLAVRDTGKRRTVVQEDSDDSDDAVEAITLYRVEEAFAGLALIEARILTGRTHQLRAHFASIGCPIAGDKIYGDKAANRHLREKAMLLRQFIHARRLAFDHPVTGARLDLTARLPKDLVNVLTYLRRPVH